MAILLEEERKITYIYVLVLSINDFIKIILLDWNSKVIKGEIKFKMSISLCKFEN